MTILIIIALLLIRKIIVMLLDICNLSIRLVKTKDITSQVNNQEKNYQFIKGLY